MILDPATPIIPTVIIGEDKVLTCQLKDAASGDSIDISSASEIVAHLVKSDDTCIEKKLTLGGVVITSGANGKFNILLTSADTLLLKPSEHDELSSFEVYLTLAGKLSIIQFVNSLSIIPKLFPNC